MPDDADKVEGYTYDGTEYPVIVTVEEVNGRLTIKQPTTGEPNAAIVTNTFTMPKMSASGTKTWVGRQACENIPTVTIQLWQNNSAPAEGDMPLAQLTLSMAVQRASFQVYPNTTCMA